MRMKNVSGFTLIELILVMVIVSLMVVAGINYVQIRSEQMRIDRTSLQMQAILNAALAYYVANGQWPNTNNDPITTLKTSGFLPNVAMTNPWGQVYSAKVSTIFSLWTSIPGGSPGVAKANANSIMGTLPLAFTSINPPNPGTCPSMGPCYVVAQVNIPGQNLNRASAVNFAGLYHHGGCVPVPTCPVDAQNIDMQPQIMVVPVSVSGVNDPNNSSNVYPISSFTAYALGPSSGSNNPPNCSNPGATSDPCTPTSGPASQTGYWRVCLNVITEKGNVATTNTTGTTTNSFPYYPWGGDVTLLAFTRCAIQNETAGSTFSVYSQ